MKKINIFYIFVVSIATLVLIGCNHTDDGTSSTQYSVANKTIDLSNKIKGSTYKLDSNLPTHKKSAEEPPPKERDYNISTEDFLKARKQARQMKAKAKYISNAKTKTLNGPNAAPQWEMRGPYTYGRITAIVADPENPDKIYVGTPLGGVWKSTDGGAHYTPIFDHSGGSLSIGSLALDPHDSDIIYVGTGYTGGGGGFGD
ncbi:MAG: hypothetical protein DSZ09_00160, partial [Sulfurovum sp.]